MGIVSMGRCVRVFTLLAGLLLLAACAAGKKGKSESDNPQAGGDKNTPTTQNPGKPTTAGRDPSPPSNDDLNLGLTFQVGGTSRQPEITIQGKFEISGAIWVQLPDESVAGFGDAEIPRLSSTFKAPGSAQEQPLPRDDKFKTSGRRVSVSLAQWGTVTLRLDEVAPLPRMSGVTLASVVSDGFLNSTEITEQGTTAIIASVQAENAKELGYVVTAPGQDCGHILTTSYQLTVPVASQLNILSDGVYKVCVVASNVDGVKVFADSPSFSKDTTQPGVGVITLATELADGYASAVDLSLMKPVIAHTGVDAADSMAYKYILASDSCTAGQTQSTIPQLIFLSGYPDQSYAVCVLVTDLAGNTASAKSTNFIKDTVAPSLTVSGLPSAPTLESTFILSAHSADGGEAFVYKYGANATTDCNDALGYSVEKPLDTPLSLNTGAVVNTTLKFCARARDFAGNWASGSLIFSATWLHDNIAPANPSSFFGTAGVNVSHLSLTDLASDEAGHIIVRSSSGPVSWMPVSGQTYAVGAVVAPGQTVIANHRSADVDDTSLTNATLYHYQVFAYDAVLNYASGIATQVQPFAAPARFNFARNVNNTVRVIANAKDGSGKIYVAGLFSNDASGVRGRLMRLNSDYSIDTSFNMGVGFNSDIYAVVPLPDGDVYVGGSFTTLNGVSVNRIVRLNADGSRDTAFNVGTGLNNIVYAMAWDSAMADLYLTGAFTTYKGVSYARLLRVNSDGSVDSAFAVGSGLNNTGFALALDESNRRLYVGGQFTSYNGDTQNRLFRVAANGQVDTSFAIGTAADNIVYALWVQPDLNAVLVGGQFVNFNGVAANRLVALDLTGAVHSSLQTGTGFNNVVSTLFYDAGQFYVGGTFTTYKGVTANRLVRIGANGAMDANFAVGTGFDNYVYAMDRNPADQSLLIGGSFVAYRGLGYNRLVDIKALDASPNGKIANGSGFNNTVNSVDVDPSTGDYYVAGAFTRHHNTAASRIQRIDYDATNDGAFNTGAGANNTIQAIKYSKFSRAVYFGGAFTSYRGTARNRFIKVASDGVIDTSFNIGTGFDNTVFSIELDPVNTDVYVGGQFTTYKGVAQNRLARLNADGSVDSAFNVGSGPDDIVRTIVSSADGQRLFIGGDFTNYAGTGRNYLAAVDSTGALASDFIIGSGFNARLYALAVDSSGNIYAGGEFTSYNGTNRNRLVKINPNGALDATFNCGSCANNFVRALVIDEAHHQLYVAGDFTSFNGVAANRLVRLDTVTGAIDGTYNTAVGFNGSVYSLLLHADRLIAGGAFTAFNNFLVERLARINTSEVLE